MPGRYVHNTVAAAILRALKGKELTKKEKYFINRLNKEIDKPHKILGNKHRILYHDVDGMILALMLAKKYRIDPSKAIILFLTHIVLDKIFSKK